MKKCESVFIKILDLVLELQFDRSSNILICKKNSVYRMCTAAVHLGLKDRSLDYFAHKLGLGLSTQRVTCYFLR